MHRLLLAFVCALAAAPVLAQPSSGPQPTPMPAAIEAPRDVSWPGVVRLAVDATDLDRRIFRVRETIPLAQAGPVTLLYPAWLPGNHAPRGQLEDLAGLTIRAGGKIVPWTRDPLDVYAFHLDVPACQEAKALFR